MSCIVASLGVLVVPDHAEAAPMVIDKETGHFKDMSYEALTDEGLSWEQRTQLFGGETAHYGELTAKQRQAKQLELNRLLDKIDMKLVNRCETDIRTWLDRQAGDLPSVYSARDMWNIRYTALIFFRAYEIFGDRKYLDTGLTLAELILKAQFSKGHWPAGPLPKYGEHYLRIQDGTTTGNFWVMLQAHKLTGDKKYFESARRCADVLLSVQRDSGGWGDQWWFSGRGLGHTGVRLGTSHNDRGTTAPTQIMVVMYHMTKDKKYIEKMGNLGPFIAGTNLGEGNVVGWAQQYHDNGRPARARQYEIEICYPSAITRSVGPLLIWLYLMTGEEKHMDLLKRAYAWHEEMRRFDLKPENWKCWQIMKDAHIKTNGPDKSYRPGWGGAYLPDGSNCGAIFGFAMYPCYPVTAAMREKYGRFIHSERHLSNLSTSGSHPMMVGEKRGDVHKWAEAVLAGKPPARTWDGCARGNAMVQVRRALLEHKRGGHKGLLKYYTNPTKYTPDQYLQARVDAAKRALDERNVKLAANPEKKGILAVKNAGGLLGRKCRWYGPVPSKWGNAYRTTGQWGSVAWYQWQFVYDAMLAQGKISADAAARGGRGLEDWISWQTHLDSWDVLGHWDMNAYEMENYFDVPIGKK